MAATAKDPCWCHMMPKHPTEGYLLGRCNHCWNGLVESKNELVRENQELLAGLAHLCKGAHENSQV